MPWFNYDHGNSSNFIKRQLISQCLLNEFIQQGKEAYEITGFLWIFTGIQERSIIMLRSQGGRAIGKRIQKDTRWILEGYKLYFYEKLIKKND